MTVKLEDMRLFARVAETRSFTAAARLLGVPKLPEFACAADVRRRRLVPVLDDHVVEVGSVWLVYPVQRFLVARVRTFVELAVAQLAREPPWQV